LGSQIKKCFPNCLNCRRSICVPVTSVSPERVFSKAGNWQRIEEAG
jgi:hypothetical protein